MSILGSWDGDSQDSNTIDIDNLCLSLAPPKLLQHIVRNCCRTLANLAATSPFYTKRILQDLESGSIDLSGEDLTDEMAREYLSFIDK